MFLAFDINSRILQQNFKIANIILVEKSDILPQRINLLFTIPIQIRKMKINERPLQNLFIEYCRLSIVS